MTLLGPLHVSVDVTHADAEPRWLLHVTGEPGRKGTFDHWTVHAARDGAIEDYCGAWIRRHLKGYTGIINTETIGGGLIPRALPPSGQKPGPLRARRGGGGGSPLSGGGGGVSPRRPPRAAHAGVFCVPCAA